MHILKRLFNFYLNASIHVALAVVSLYLLSVETLNVSTNWNIVGFLFFGTIVCYNFMKFGVEAEKYLIVSNPYHKLIQFFSFFAFALAGYFFWRLGKDLWMVVFVLMGVSGLYAVPLLPNTKNLRSLGGMKIFLVAFVWMGCTLLLPIREMQLDLTWDLFILMIRRVLLVLILLMPFEIRDLQYDDKALRTVPQRVGVQKTKQLTYVLISSYMFLVFLKDEITQVELVSNFVFGGLLATAIFMTKEKQTKYFASFWVESLPILFLGIWYALARWL